MTTELKQAIEVLKAHKDRDGLGSKVYEAIDTVVAELEKPTYTPAYMNSFAEWCSVNGWEYQMFEGEWWNERDEIKTTAQLREIWEKERKEESKMSKVVYEYTLPITDVILLQLPKNAEILFVETQNDTPCIWFLVNPKLELEPRYFHLYGTGMEIEGDTLHENVYVGTFKLRNDSLILHLFERVDL